MGNDKLKIEKHKADNKKRLEAIDKQQQNLKKHKQLLNNALAQSLNKSSSKTKKVYFSESKDGSGAKTTRKGKPDPHGAVNVRKKKVLNAETLEKIIGPLKQTNKRKKPKQFDQPAKMIRYNPSNTDHKVYEIDTRVQSEIEPQEVPQVSKDKYFDVSNSLIAGLKDDAEKGSFSLLKMIKGDDDVDDEPSIEENQIYFPPTEEDEEDESPEQPAESAKKTRTAVQPARTGKSTDPFFLSTNDSRLAKGSSFFCRKESLADTHKSWVEKRAVVNKEFNAHMKQAKHRHNPVVRLGNKKRFSFINARKKRF